MLARLAALALLTLTPWPGDARAQRPKPPVQAPGPVAPAAPKEEPANPAIAWGLAVILSAVVLVVVCMPSRKG